MARSSAPGSSGLGNGSVGKGTVGLELRRDASPTLDSPPRAKRSHHHRAADTVQGRIGDRQIAAPETPNRSVKWLAVLVEQVVGYPAVVVTRTFTQQSASWPRWRVVRRSRRWAE